MLNELDSVIRSSLASLVQELTGSPWRGRREREIVSLFCFGHLAEQVKPHSFLRDLAQIGIEVPVPRTAKDLQGHRYLRSSDDPDHSQEEQRYATIGTSSKQRIVFLAHVDRGEDHVRIISARPATVTEAHAYQKSRK